MDQLLRDVLVKRGARKGISHDALEIAISVTVLDEIFEEKDGVVRHPPGKSIWILPSEQLAFRGSHSFTVQRKALASTLSTVKDVVAWRADGRPAAPHPLDAFEELLVALGHQRFRAWWAQKRSELRLLDHSLNPVSVTVLCAALTEAALSFIVPRAQAAGLMKEYRPSKAAVVEVR